ncbi:hypothetical protein CIB93_30800 [Streptomyces sp. WZ.A104]|uniref:hypothetical protein n=1 Tax=Streptomyces sp. WZ.A104 TaxID=2023771 RepID=UPI000BBCA636|nr:hypothetical protein [Streptomyces sp. WZ.A104]PCG82299.1 hypothetical protein CIB93_30800 [Streptomyces sp. WZ.A104]
MNSTPIPRERGERARAAQQDRLQQAVAAGRLAPDIAGAMTDPALSRWRASNGFAVVTDIEALTGPSTGKIQVPGDLVREAVPSEVDTADTAALWELYRVVLADGTAEQQAILLNRTLLKSLWRPGLAEEPIMRVWESRFPELAGRR